jgi:hypothetical protein
MKGGWYFRSFFTRRYWRAVGDIFMGSLLAGFFMRERFWKSVADDAEKRRREREGGAEAECEPGEGYNPDPYGHRLSILAGLVLAVGFIIYSAWQFSRANS